MPYGYPTGLGPPSTPGKVTGGGQIEGRIQSSHRWGACCPCRRFWLPARQAQAGKPTFGFVVKYFCCHRQRQEILEYNDHESRRTDQSDVVYWPLISNGSCGTNTHARFTGTADVIRPTGTTSEPFTVNVDDCGEPGWQGKIGSRPTTYCNPAACGGTNI